jgi:hypothetical protein
MNFKFLQVTFIGLMFSVYSVVNIVSAGLITTPGGNTVGGFSSSEVYGQSFLVGKENILDSVILSGRSIDGSDNGVIFELFQWDDTLNQVIGGTLFSALGEIKASNTLLPVSLLTGGWELVSGEAYIFSMRHDDSQGRGNWGYDYSTDNYADGSFHYANTSTYLNTWYGSDFGGLGRDMQIEMKFSAAEVIEPSTLAIFALGIIALALHRFKKQS